MAVLLVRDSLSRNAGSFLGTCTRFFVFERCRSGELECPEINGRCRALRVPLFLDKWCPRSMIYVPMRNGVQLKQHVAMGLSELNVYGQHWYGLHMGATSPGCAAGEELRNSGMSKPVAPLWYQSHICQPPLARMSYRWIHSPT